MDKKLACHNIALTAANIFVESKKPEYTISGYSKLVEDLTIKYIEAYEQASMIIDKQPKSSSMRVLK